MKANNGFKKMLSLILAAALILTLLPAATAYAETRELSFRIEPSGVNVRGEIGYKISVKGANDLLSIKFEIEFSGRMMTPAYTECFLGFVPVDFFDLIDLDVANNEDRTSTSTMRISYPSSGMTSGFSTDEWTHFATFVFEAKAPGAAMLTIKSVEAYKLDFNDAGEPMAVSVNGTLANNAASTTIRGEGIDDPIIPIFPRITGPSSLTIWERYGAFYTPEFIITGTPVPIVTITANSHITWDNSEKRLHIDAGLPVGVYYVVMTASNGVVPNATHQFTLMVVGVQHLYGDIDGDGILTPLDVTRLLRYFSGLDASDNNFMSANADVNGDGIVNSLDVTRLLRYFSGLDPSPLGP